MLRATSESALRYFSALGVLIWIYDPTASITRGDPRQETADPFPLTRRWQQKRPSPKSTAGRGASEPRTRHRVYPSARYARNCQRRGADEQTPLLALACESLCSRLQADRRTVGGITHTEAAAAQKFCATIAIARKPQANDNLYCTSATNDPLKNQ